jgi:hypothetical protein
MREMDFEEAIRELSQGFKAVQELEWFIHERFESLGDPSLVPGVQGANHFGEFSPATRLSITDCRSKPQHREAGVEPKAVEVELQPWRIKLAAEPGQLVARAEQAAHLVEHRRIQPDDAVAISA